MAHISTIDQFTAPIGKQQIDLQHVDHEEGGLNMLRVRIREGKRFTIFDIDPETAKHWAAVMQKWAEAQQQA
ncbi:DUF6967 family protein [Sideroxyarcus sp. TK5]|jgi:hypothetical protein